MSRMGGGGGGEGGVGKYGRDYLLEYLPPPTFFPTLLTQVWCGGLWGLMMVGGFIDFFFFFFF